MAVEPIERLTRELARLPGIGQKTAQRLAFHILAMDEARVRDLSVAIFNAKKQVHACPVCGNYTDAQLCELCADPKRRRDVICVVRDPRDVNAIERMRDYNGKYHVLHGTLSPMDGIGPDDIHIKELMTRLQTEPVSEVILATNPDIEGEATATYIARLIKPMGIKCTRIAHGVPVGSDLEYADEITLGRALAGRRAV